MANWLSGKSLLEINLEKILPGGRAMILAYDQGFEHGPRDFKDNPASSDPVKIIQIAKEGGFTGLVVHGGIAGRCKSMICDSGVPLILKLNGRSEAYTGDDPYSPLLYARNAEEAIAWAEKLGAAAVGYTVYTGSKYENKMNQEFSQIAVQAHKLGLLAIAWMYPRGESLVSGKSAVSKKALEEMEELKKLGIELAIDETPAWVGYGARLGMEMGADIVKVKYTGSVETFRQVVQFTKPTKVVMSGGPKTDMASFLRRIGEVMKAGGAGVAVGRNVWQGSDYATVSLALKTAVFSPVFR